MALGCIVELGKAEAVFGESIEIGGFDFRPVAADVGVAEVIDHDDEEVGLLGRVGGKVQKKCEEKK